MINATIPIPFFNFAFFFLPQQSYLISIILNINLCFSIHSIEMRQFLILRKLIEILKVIV